MLPDIWQITRDQGERPLNEIIVSIIDVRAAAQTMDGSPLTTERCLVEKKKEASG
jgi:hypothetical protein